MKLNKSIYAIIALLFLVACEGEKSLQEESVFDTSTPELSELDIWLRESFVNPYNIDVLYKWEDSQVEQSRYLFPPTEKNVKPLMEQVLNIWVNSYSEVGGNDFIKKTAPRQIVLVGGENINTNGTVTLGLADSGNKVTLFEVDIIDLANKEEVRRFFRTIQHEYCHILNQNKIFSPQFEEITPEGYDGSWHLTSVAAARELGFITNYARSKPSEDFAEMVATMLIYSKEEYEAILKSIKSEEAVANIRKKEAMVVEYFLKDWNIDIYELQALNYEKLVELTGE